MKTHLLRYRNSDISYQTWGTGGKWLFCLHGYGEDSQSFEPFAPLLADEYTMIAIDLPFHGHTEWREGLLFDPADLVAIINLIKPASHSFSLLGYSMGGRVALQLAGMIPQQIERMVLVAPDGLHKNKWQWLATQTKAGNRLFAYCMQKPATMLFLADTGTKWGFFNKSLLRFVHYYLDKETERELLYLRWTTMRRFKPNQVLIKKEIIQCKIVVHLIFGAFDRVILPKHGYHFSKNANKLITVTEIASGHLLLKEKHIPQIAGFLLA